MNEFDKEFYSYDNVDARAAAQVVSGRFRIVFVCADLTIADRYDWHIYAQKFMKPIKWYRRLSCGAIEVKAINNWRRN